MPVKVAVVCLPPIMTTPSQSDDRAGFKGQAESIIRRNQRKHGGEGLPKPLGKNARGEPAPRQAIFSSGASADVAEAFQALGREGIGAFEKVYLLAHGNMRGVESPVPARGDDPIRMTASELATKFMDDAGLGQALLDKLGDAAAKGGKAEFKLSIRLLACQAGMEAKPGEATFESRSATSYLHDFGNMLGREVAKTLERLKQQHPAKYSQASLSVRISLAAPTGWSVVTHSGQTLTYDAPPEKESVADAAVGAAFESSADKWGAYKYAPAKPYLRPEELKKQTLTVRLQKFPGGDGLSGEVS